MVGILSLNACIDKTFRFDNLPCDGVNIPYGTFVQAGGKGINVSRVLRTFEVNSKLFTMTAGENGEMLKRLLKQDKIDFEATEVCGNTREYITVIDDKHNQFALKERGPQVSENERKRLETELENFLDKNDISFLCISDTIPCERLVDFYAYAVEIAKKRGITVFADLDGEALKSAIDKCPDIIKPNIDEYSEIMSIAPEKINLDKEIESLIRCGIPNPIISLGKDGAITGGQDGIFLVNASDTKCVSPVGCGDSFVAGIIYGKESGMAWNECVKWATAAGAANCEEWKAACLEYDKIAEKYKNVNISKRK